MPTAVEEKDAIRELLAEYCFRLDDGRFEEMAALFTDAGTWDTAFGKATGRAAIADLARNIRAQARETRPRGIHLVTNIAIALDRESARVSWHGQRVDLTLTEFRVVDLLVKRGGKDVSYREIYDAMRGEGFHAGSGEDGYRANVRALIKRIRQKFAAVDPGFAALENYAGFGYRWNDPGS